MSAAPNQKKVDTFLFAFNYMQSPWGVEALKARRASATLKARKPEQTEPDGAPRAAAGEAALRAVQNSRAGA